LEAYQKTFQEGGYNEVMSDATRLDHVYWLGGSPCAGKSSISEILAERFNLEIYPVDTAINVHFQRINPHQHPNLCHWQAMSWEERWMLPQAELLSEVIACYSEHFSLVFDDVMDFASKRRLLVEGSALLVSLDS
jgi:2-phosphoglycerate kinase